MAVEVPAPGPDAVEEGAADDPAGIGEECGIKGSGGDPPGDRFLLSLVWSDACFFILNGNFPFIEDLVPVDGKEAARCLQTKC